MIHNDPRLADPRICGATTTTPSGATWTCVVLRHTSTPPVHFYVSGTARPTATS